MKLISWPSGCILTAVLVAAFGFQKNPSVHQQPLDSKSEEGVKDLALKAISVSEAKPKAPENVKEFGLKLQRISNLKASLKKDEERQAQLEDLARDPAFLLLAKKAILDLDWVTQTYGTHQADIRIQAIQLLRAQASRGDFGPLEEAGRLLSSQLQKSNQWVKGREFDLTDLVGAWIESQGREVVLQNPERLFRTFKYTPRLKYVFARSVMTHLRKGPVDSETDQILMPFWNKDFS